MERIRKRLTDVGTDRAFAPGRLRRQWMARAYERLVPIPRWSGGQESRNRQPEVREEYRWA